MFLCNDLVIKLVLSVLFMSSTGNDDKSINAEHGFESSLATNNNIVSDVNQRHNADSDVCKRDPFLVLNTSKQCFPTLKKKKCLFELYNLTEQTTKQNLTAERRNQRLYGKSAKAFLQMCFFFEQDCICSVFTKLNKLMLLFAMQNYKEFKFVFFPKHFFYV